MTQGEDGGQPRRLLGAHYSSEPRVCGSGAVSGGRGPARPAANGAAFEHAGCAAVGATGAACGNPPWREGAAWERLLSQLDILDLLVLLGVVAQLPVGTKRKFGIQLLCSGIMFRLL